MEIGMNQHLNKRTLSPVNKLFDLNNSGKIIGSTELSASLVKKEETTDCPFEVVKVKEEFNDLSWGSSTKNYNTSTSIIKTEPQWNQVEIKQFSEDTFMYEKDEEQKPDLIFLSGGKLIENDEKNNFLLHLGTNFDRLADSSSQQEEVSVKTESVVIGDIKEKPATVECKIKNEVVYLKKEGFLQNQIIIPSGAVNQETRGEYKKYQCHVCEYQTKWPSNFNKHVDRHNNPAKIKIIRCDYKIFHNDDSKTNSQQHGDETRASPFDWCKYQTTNQRNLRRHVLRQHTNKEKVYTFKCEDCDYQALQKNHLKVHRRRHKQLEEVDASDKYKCNKYSYQTLLKGNLNVHLLRHKNIEEVDASDRLTCGLCEYQTLEKGKLKQHTLSRHKITELNTFRCFHCEYQTVRKSHLKTHLLRHKNIEDVDASDKFQCQQCEYETLDRSSLKQHILLKHKNIPEMGTLKCHICNYLTPRKGHLKKHILRHKSIEEVDVSDKFQCDQCDYQTLEKGNLNKHMLMRHKNIEEVEVFQCNRCKYSSRLRSNLKKHLQRHKNREGSNLV